MDYITIMCYITHIFVLYDFFIYIYYTNDIRLNVLLYLSNSLKSLVIAKYIYFMFYNREL